MNVSRICNDPEGVVKLNRFVSLTITLSLFLFSGRLFAEETVGGISEPLASGRIINVSLGLLFVLVVFFLLAYLLKRMPSMQGARNGCLNIIDTLYLGSNERILLIQVGEQQILVGANSQKIETLHVLPEALDVKPSQQAVPFKDQFANILSANSKKGSAS